MMDSHTLRLPIHLDVIIRYTFSAFNVLHTHCIRGTWRDALLIGVGGGTIIVISAATIIKVLQGLLMLWLSAHNQGDSFILFNIREIIDFNLASSVISRDFWLVEKEGLRVFNHVHSNSNQ